jgi:amidophosphoribosyltransferase
MCVHERPTHECGIFAIHGHSQATALTYYGLLALQHRGQESAGIVSVRTTGELKSHRAMGLVPEAIPNSVLNAPSGFVALGHVRYSTRGASSLKNCQPLFAGAGRDLIVIAHNGNLTNAGELREELREGGFAFATTSDTEVLLALLRGKVDLSSALRSLRLAQGAFSCVTLLRDSLIGLRDPFGFRPLVLGRVENAFVLASETCALDAIGATLIREVEPGEAVIISKTGVKSEWPFRDERLAFCIFELIYFGRADSLFRGTSLAEIRIEMGRELARLFPVKGDIVVPIPDSGVHAALGFSYESKTDFLQAFLRNVYVGRTFIEPDPKKRALSADHKLRLIPSLVQGKRVILVDDSLVRGTTAKRRISDLRNAGVREVHLRISCPPHGFPCYYGIDFPDPAELLVNRFSGSELTSFLGVDSIGYLPIDSVIRAASGRRERFCLACFDGDYPAPTPSAQEQSVL